MGSDLSRLDPERARRNGAVHRDTWSEMNRAKLLAPRCQSNLARSPSVDWLERLPRSRCGSSTSAVVLTPPELVGQQQEHPVGQSFASLEELEAPLHVDLPSTVNITGSGRCRRRRANADDLGEIR
jgi:hypothetical protein